MSAHCHGLDDTREVTGKILHRCFLIAGLWQLRRVLRRRVIIPVHFLSLSLCLTNTITGLFKVEPDFVRSPINFSIALERWSLVLVLLRFEIS